jgi:uncharacterized protein (DUF302 family)
MPDGEVEITIKVSARSVADTFVRLLELLAARGMKVFAVIDQQVEAQSVGLPLRPTTLVLFGNPAAGTPVMVAAPLAALDLPLKILVWADGTETKVSYVSPVALAARYHLTPELARNLAGVDGLTDALVAP